MALSHILTGAGATPASIDTSATVSLEQEGGGWSITAVHLSVAARVPGLDEAKFQTLAGEAKANCPVSKALGSIEIQLDARVAH